MGLAKGVPHGFTVDEAVVNVGHGQVAFERAQSALAAWKHFDVEWVQVFPANASTEPGTVVTVLIHHFGFWSLNGCRVVYKSDSTAAGFAYGTLTNHAESGEEIFNVFLRPESGEVIYRIRAASRPRAIVTRLGFPVARMLQAKFRRDSAEALRREIARAV